MRTAGIGAREAQTRYQVRQWFPHFTLLEVHPLTGRTHQIRVHLASIGHPVVGDTLYGAPSKLRISGSEERTLERNFLHASAISFRHPRSGKMLKFEARLPAELEQFLRRIEAIDAGPISARGLTSVRPVMNEG